MDRILEPLSEFGTLDLIRTQKGPVAGTGLRYLFETYEIPIKPDMLELRKPIIRDRNLCERKKGFIESYVAEIYEQ
jgi:hypothetical protein